MIAVYQKGDLTRVDATFANSVGAPTDPTAVSFKYTKPSGTIVTLVYPTDAALAKDSVGNYHVDMDLTESGVWYYRFIGTGAVQAVEEGQFSVEPSGF